MNVAFEVGLWLPARHDHVEDRAACAQLRVIGAHGVRVKSAAC